MKYTIILILALIFSANIAISKNVPVAGDWLLTKIESQDGDKDVYAPVSFQTNGDFIAMDMNMGTWNFDKKANVVNIVSEQFKVANGDNNVIILNSGEMVLQSAMAKLYFKRMDKEKITKENASSGLIGTWKIPSDNTEVMTLITFITPDSFSYVKKEPGVITNGSGTWIFSNKDHSLIFVARIEDLEKKYNITNISAEEFSLENNGDVIKIIKTKTPAKIEHLTFKPDDFFDADGDFKYENEDGKLPWKDAYSVYDYLNNIQQLVYKYSSLVQGTMVFQSKELVANVDTYENNDKVCIDFIFNGYDRAHLPEDTSLPPNCISDDDYYNRLFPEKESDYRIVGKDDVTTPAGTFRCTIIESIGDRDQRYKMWMIDDKPGVYAKIIEEDPDENFGYYHVYELQKIK